MVPSPFTHDKFFNFFPLICALIYERKLITNFKTSTLLRIILQYLLSGTNMKYIHQNKFSINVENERTMKRSLDSSLRIRTASSVAAKVNKRNQGSGIQKVKAMDLLESRKFFRQKLIAETRLST